MKTIFQALAEIEKNQEIAALATIVRSRGSTPRHGASKLLVYEDGRAIGTVGGGELERRVHAEALAAMQDGEARYLSYNMADPSKGDPGV